MRLLVTIVTANNTGILHLLNLLKDTIAHMSSQVLNIFLYLQYLLLLWYQAIKKLCEKILKLLLLGNAVKCDCITWYALNGVIIS